MDTVTRQTSQHLEFEPEWEGAFNLQLKMEDSLVMFTEWCATDVSGAWTVSLVVWMQPCTASLISSLDVATHSQSH